LFLTAIHEGRLTLEDVLSRMSANVRRIFGVPLQAETWVEIDPDHKHTLSTQGMYSKAAWTPFEGWPAHGLVRQVILRGQTVFQDGLVLAEPGTGQPVR
jgi:dihydroorotase-like cyclic amidohydrolase